MRLFEAVRHLDPIILTGLPCGNWAADQKVRWATEHFPGTHIITCMAIDKRCHCEKGDVLVDDTLKHWHLWEGPTASSSTTAMSTKRCASLPNIFR